ncbi:MAG: peptide deformylase [Burkholderiales bacterium]|nr:peptide deformylase [Burkholderiales bacterium]
MIREIVRMGDPRLQQVAREVEPEMFNTPELDALLQDMRETMRAQSGVGIAAPQIGVPLRVLVFGAEQSERYPEAPPIPYTELINPVLTPLDETMEEAWEGCLSLPGLLGIVPRYTRMRYAGFDPQGRYVVRDVEGFHARVVQHECDHLDGVLYPTRMRDMSRFGFADVLSPYLDS